jgi:hypothetical protein
MIAESKTSENLRKSQNVWGIAVVWACQNRSNDEVYPSIYAHRAIDLGIQEDD